MGRMFLSSAAALLGAVSVVVPGCTSAVFTCADNSQCRGNGNGTCQTNGFCSFPDSTCPSGQRYGNAAGGGFAGDCVDPDGGTGDTGLSSSGEQTSTTTLAPIGSSTTETETETTPISDTGSTSSTGGANTASSSETGAPGSTGSTGSDGCAGTPVIDEFDDAELSALWEPPAGNGTFALKGGRATFTVSVSGLDAPLYIQSADTFGFPGASLLGELPAQAQSADTQFFVSLLGTDGQSFSVVVHPAFVAAQHGSGNQFEDLGTVARDPDAPVSARLREVAGTIHFDVSTDGTTFDTFRTYESPDPPTDVRIWLGYDNFELISPGPTFELERVEGCFN